MSILKTNELKNYYGIEPNLVKALDGVGLNVEQGELVAFVAVRIINKGSVVQQLRNAE
ncbi:MAG: hypothetical protein ACERKN_10410 [Velocimicrobium sp.]